MLGIGSIPAWDRGQVRQPVQDGGQSLKWPSITFRTSNSIIKGLHQVGCSYYINMNKLALSRIIFSLYCQLFLRFRYNKICSIKITSQCKILIVPEEGWFGQPKYSPPTNNHSTLCRRLLLFSSFYTWSRLEHYWSNVHLRDHRSGCLLKRFLEDAETRPRGCKCLTLSCALAKVLPDEVIETKGIFFCVNHALIFIS